MSSLVAVAGGTGGLGRTIVEAIIAAGKFEVVVLARKRDEEKEKEIGARIICVDYTSIEALTKTLDDNKVHTVISVLKSMGNPEPESNLIVAADRASATKRYIPSVWGIEYTEEIAANFPIAKAKLQETVALKQTSLEHTQWFTGYFADYYVAPNVKSNMTILHVVADVGSNVAAIPGSGNVPVAFTHTLDVAKLVAASLTLPKWEPKTYVIGDRLTLNELIAVAESVKGTKFSVTYDSVDMLKAGKITELPSHPAMYPFFPKEQLQGLLATIGLSFENGYFDLKPERTISQTFPDVKLRSLKDMLEEAWRK